MAQLHTFGRNSLIALGLAMMSVALLAVYSIYAAISLTVVLVIFFATMVHSAMTGLRLRKGNIGSSESRFHTYKGNKRVERLSIIMPDGQEQVAQVVPVEQHSGYKYVLTRTGYVLLNEYGQPVYRLPATYNA